MAVKRNSTETLALQTSAPTTEAQIELQEEIRRRAYELYKLRGGSEGRELDDWLQAEAEVTHSIAKAA